MRSLRSMRLSGTVRPTNGSELLINSISFWRARTRSRRQRIWSVSYVTTTHSETASPGSVGFPS